MPKGEKTSYMNESEKDQNEIFEELLSNAHFNSTAAAATTNVE
jgi:hypothetical protein